MTMLLLDVQFRYYYEIHKHTHLAYKSMKRSQHGTQHFNYNHFLFYPLSLHLINTVYKWIQSFKADNGYYFVFFISFYLFIDRRERTMEYINKSEKIDWFGLPSSRCFIRNLYRKFSIEDSVFGRLIVCRFNVSCLCHHTIYFCWMSSKRWIFIWMTTRQQNAMRHDTDGTDRAVSQRNAS